MSFKSNLCTVNSDYGGHCMKLKSAKLNQIWMMIQRCLGENWSLLKLMFAVWAEIDSRLLKSHLQDTQHWSMLVTCKCPTIIFCKSMQSNLVALSTMHDSKSYGLSELPVRYFCCVWCIFHKLHEISKISNHFQGQHMPVLILYMTEIGQVVTRV